MKTFIDALYQDLQNRLQSIWKQGTLLEKIENSLFACDNTIGAVKSAGLQYPYLYKKDQLSSFKWIRPCFCSIKQYYFLIYNYELFKPLELEAKQLYRARRLEKIDKLLATYNEVNNLHKPRKTGEPAYCVSGSCAITNQGVDKIRHAEIFFDASQEYSPTIILAYGMFSEYISNEEDEINGLYC